MLQEHLQKYVRGRAFEVMPEGKIVWEFYNPDVQPKIRARAVIYRMIRFPTSFISYENND